MLRRILPLKPKLNNHYSVAMAGLDVNSKVRMNSGYEMPVLGYGVGLWSQIIDGMLTFNEGLSNVG